MTPSTSSYGTLTLHLDEEMVDAPPGTFVCVPPGIVHTFSNPGDVAIRFLNLSTSAGFENYMRDLGRELTGPSPPTPDEIGRIASRYDFHAANMTLEEGNRNATHHAQGASIMSETQTTTTTATGGGTTPKGWTTNL